LRGFVPYESQRLELSSGYYTEREYAIHLKENERLSWKDIAAKVNLEFGNNRKPESIRSIYNRKWRKRE